MAPEPRGRRMYETVTVTTSCPSCGEVIELVVDTSIPNQEYTEDCPVCCRPMVLRVEVGTDGMPAVDARREDE